MKKVKIIKDCYGYKRGETPSLPYHIAQLLIVKGCAVEFQEEETKPKKKGK